MQGMIVYESDESIGRDPEDTARFESSYKALEEAGIPIRRVRCTSAEDIVTDGEARDMVAGEGMGCLPVTEYDRVVIAHGEYPSDQDLADFLNPPDGTLSVNSQKPPSMGNDIMPACNCGQRR